ncbi:hypothetical protein PT7_1421 [Pusillimonas sp. T7-7]|uniref:hypothetical protein n=1 Tax=Pusillimonas sp. (strain T7-7) TaxID=1007105 RepID=UPI0002084B2D|nr:hypothetical protein [Pusillimonas sp. T7-7]AEC19961.1 hypothetical protein PT7_1421 [Pusillimonas sp. T7-7]
MAPDSEPLILPMASGALVFGMDWFPMIGPQPGRAGLKLARKHGSTHLVLPVAALGSAGLVSLKRQLPSRKVKLYSAAQNVAQLFATGSVAVLIELQQFGYWLVAIHEGAVVARTDQIYRSRDDAGDVIDGLRQAYPQLQVLAQEQDSRLPTLVAVMAASSIRSQLQPLRHWQSVMPWPVQFFVLALVLVLLLPRVWLLFDRTHSSHSDPAQLEPGQTWREAVLASAGGRQVHGGKGLRALLDSFYALPTRLGGWALQQAVCEAAGSRWQCQAGYERLGAKASNSSFLAVVPPTWVIEFSSLDRATARWQSESHSVPLLRLNLPSSAQNERYLLSSLQAIRPAFAQMHLGQPIPIPLLIPKDQQGQPLPRPKDQAVYASRLVQISGPLRSASLLLPNAQSMAWQKATLTLRQAEQADLIRSKLNLSLQGFIYEIDKAMDDSPVAGLCARLDGGRCAGP